MGSAKSNAARMNIVMVNTAIIVTCLWKEKVGVKVVMEMGYVQNALILGRESKTVNVYNVLQQHTVLKVKPVLQFKTVKLDLLDNLHQTVQSANLVTE